MSPSSPRTRFPHHVLRSVCPVLSALVAVALPLVCTAAPVPQGDKPKITRLDDLPRHTYEVTTTVTEVVQSPAIFAPFAAALRADIEADLAAFDIEDKTTLAGLHGTLLQLDLLEGDYDAVLAAVEVLRELEDKPGLKLTTGVGAEARVAAAREVGGMENLDAFKQAYQRHYAEGIDALPWELVQDILQSTKARMEMLSEALILGVVEQRLDPLAAAAGTVSGDIARQITGMHFVVQHILPVREETIAVLQAVIDAHSEEKADIWAARELDLTDHANLSPVMIGVWDTGTDPEVFADRIFTNPGETLDGEDNDGNGFIDDIHGIAYDKDALPATGCLYSMDEATRPVEELQDFAKGMFDMQAAIDTPEATALKQKMASLGQDEIRSFIEDLTRYTLYSHGTHVAGIAVAGNPAALVLVARLTGDPSMVPEAPTMEDAVNGAKSFQDAVAYFKQHGVRVVNMSWGIRRSSLERDLELNTIGQDADERKAMAREMFDVLKAGLHDAIAGAPDILFVGGAGNSDSDITFDEFIPSMFELSNLLISGAVDQAGETTTFTSFGPTVNIYANGFEVDSYVPGGDRIKFSGTSMSAPNVANLAAKLLALNPALSPAEVTELILTGADEQQQGEQQMRITHPVRSAELLRKKMSAAAH